MRKASKCRLWGRYVTFLEHILKHSHGRHVFNRRPTNILYVASSMITIYLHSKCHTFTSYDPLSASNSKRTNFFFFCTAALMLYKHSTRVRPSQDLHSFQRSNSVTHINLHYMALTSVPPHKFACPSRCD